MKNLTRLAITATVSLGLIGAAAGTASAAPLDSHSRGPVSARPTSSGQGTVFAETDAITGNAIVSFHRAANGTLTPLGTYATGGIGGALNGSAVDHTGSQGSLVRDGHNILTVNAGSNTITSFRQNGDHLIRQQVISSGGDFPVSITTHGNVVYVLNARDGGSIQGYIEAGGNLVKVPALHRELGFNPNATPEFTNTPGDISFTPDGSKLVVSTKGDGSSFEVFGSRGLLLSTSPVVSTFAGVAPFAIAFDRTGRLVAAEGGTNAVGAFTINGNGTVTRDADVATGGQATCWILPVGGSLFVTNAGTGTISTVSDTGTGPLSLKAITATDAGTIDEAATPDGRFLYVQTGAAGHVDEFTIGHNGTLTRIGTVTVPNAIGGEGIVAE
jgi:hypothetical protein